MAIGLSTGSTGQDYLPIATWDARAGRMFKVQREQQSDGSWMSDKVDITSQNPSFVVDFQSLEIGWAAFLPTGPSFVMAPLGQAMPAKPTADHKQSFKVRLFSPKFLDGLREFSSSSKAVIGQIDNLHTEYEAAPEAAAGKLPVVKLTGSKPITTKGPQGTSTNYSPTFEIVSWADRPADWPAPTVALPTAGARTSQPAPSAPVFNHVPPPAPKAAEPAKAELEDAMPF